MRAGFVFSEVLTGLRRNVTMTIAMILTTAISLGLLGFGLIVAKLTDETRTLYGDKVQVQVYLTVDQSRSDPDCTGAVCQGLLEDLRGNPDVASVSYESQEAAYQRYLRTFASQPEMIAIVRKEALSATFRVSLVDPQRFRVISQDFTGKPGVLSVDDQSEVLDKVFSLLNSVRNVAITIALIQAFAAVLLISNMVQVAALSRRTETSIMRLVGASRWRTQLPFMIEAVFAGLVGVALAILGLVVAKLTFVDKIFGSIISTGLLPPIDGTYLVFASYWLIPIGIVLSGAAAYATLRAYVRL
ncbi:permease-like cell division protein FtsX [Nakamurella endophytica]|uniref:Cell division protein FtsX n=1 Tax=Nakamurella endophytica TaxID=1748367 RepID=A0A917WII3_9ACTN|nr:permease-like cell division protein FtsX [Nakamurella endophytica]GGM07543.1 cell division protein FtsX [Nakamurella endophytica]